MLALIICDWNFAFVLKLECTSAARPSSLAAAESTNILLLAYVDYSGTLAVKQDVIVMLFGCRGPSVVLKFSEGRLDRAGADEWRWSEFNQLQLVLRRMSEDEAERWFPSRVCLCAADHYQAARRNTGQFCHLNICRIVLYFTAEYFWRSAVHCTYTNCWMMFVVWRFSGNSTCIQK